MPHPDWLSQVVTITGPAGDIAALRAAAAGAGVTPWVYDYDALEEGWFLWLIGPPRRVPSVAAARLYAAQLREANAQVHERAIGFVGMVRTCPFDLHALVPVPPAILRLPETDPVALTWLWQHWGTTWPLRDVRMRPLDAAELAALGAGQGAFRVALVSADWTPWPVLAMIQVRWPALTVRVAVDYG
ncbi:hypothetical protein [Rhodopila globiformis]|uniref:Uncharacterized protein n=1 Tax=Rhodopila globiformis TaxID=1071 RepID=A0A2S6NBE6_RHOGL|nr:hypothetical protein [Rhodopila globiformis]PPQ31921.1 hypothetical protein CCS01_16235 [Rhodopila globiformis]